MKSLGAWTKMVAPSLETRTSIGHGAMISDLV